MRKVTIGCDLCGKELPLERGKEILVETGQNAYRLLDVCSDCLDVQLQRAESINDTSGYRKTAALLMRLPGYEVPQPTSV